LAFISFFGRLVLNPVHPFLLLDALEGELYGFEKFQAS
jgi:hypothetical protein